MIITEEVETDRRQHELGQFLTPPSIADFMASLFGPFPDVVRLLDAGAGAGGLTAALVARLCSKRDGVRTINATVFEVDPTIQDSLTTTMRECQQKCDDAGIGFSFSIRATDFIREISDQMAAGLFGTSAPVFNAAIVNPPYRKINSDSAERRALRSAGVEATNLYSGFIALIQRLLIPGGQIVGITPRSFCNGPYFRPFREDFLTSMELCRLHVFDSRAAAFRGDSVLQENVIFHARKGNKQPREIIISSSSGERDDIVREACLPFDEVVHPRDSERFIHIPSTAAHFIAKDAMSGLDATLASLGIAVSTGRVVDFRLKTAIRDKPEEGAVPLLYPGHFSTGTIQWPKLDARKPNAILDNSETRPWLVPSGVYVLTKRFTSKEERRRLVACFFEPNDVRAEWLGFENHLNYFHDSGCGLDRRLAIGLFAFLNSTVVDQYFRRFSGHTQVNATDLRKMPYPRREVLVAIGTEIKVIDLAQDAIDDLVKRHLHAGR